MPRTPGMKVNGLAIKVIRERTGWSATKLCAVLDISGPHLTNIEKGARNPSPELARKIADALGVPLAAITSEKWPGDEPAAAVPA